MRSKFKWIFTLLVAFSMQFSFAQQKTVTGTVTSDGAKLPGATVSIAGTQQGTQTDENGKFSIKAAQGDVLEISFLGKETSKVTVGSGNVVNAVLAAKSESIESVLVTGPMGIKRRPDAITSSQKVISAKELTQAASPNAIQALTGKVSGIQINTASNGVKADTRIVIRGNRTIQGDNQALVVIDGAISSSFILTQLPPDVIETINVIKGAQGAALYGAQGVNGVVLVTTKKGSKKEKFTFGINSSMDFESVSFVPTVQREYGQGWANTTTEINGTLYNDYYPFENGSWGAQYGTPNAPEGNVLVGQIQPDGSFITSAYKPIKDNIKQFFKTGVLIQNGFNFNVGGADSYAFLSANRQTTDFVVQDDKLVRNSFLFKAGKKVGKFSIDGNMNYITERTSTTDAGLMNDLLQTASNVPVARFKNSGHSGSWTYYARNPFQIIKDDRKDSRDDAMNGILDLKYFFNKNISVSYLANVQMRNSLNQSHVDAYTPSTDPFDISSIGYVANNGAGASSSILRPDATDKPSSYFSSQSSVRNIYGDLLINFDYDLTQSLNLKVNLGNNIQDRMFRITSQGGANLDVPGFYHITNVLNPAQPSSLDNRIVRSRQIAGFVNADLAYKDYLFLNATGRAEQFSAVKDSYFYPSVGVSFIPTKAFKFLEDTKLNYMKLTASYTTVGNATGVQPYATNTLTSIPTGFPFGNLAALGYLNTPTSPDIAPEFVNTLEAGLQLGFFNDRFTFEGSVYRAETIDLISNVTASRGAGNLTLRTNVGDLENKGFEIDLGFVPVRTKNFKWDLRTNYTTFSTKITKLAEGQTSVNLLAGATVGIFAEVGEEFPLIKATEFVRDDSGNVLVDNNGVPLRTSSFEKQGKGVPDYIVGLTNSFEFKGLRLSVVADYRTGAVAYSEAKNQLLFTGGDLDTAGYDRYNGYVVPGVNSVTGAVNTTPYLNNPSNDGSNQYFTGFANRTGESSIIDASALKIREIALSYSLPKKLIEKAGLESLRFGVNARNPFVFLADGTLLKAKNGAENRGYGDPESNLSATSNAQGYMNIGQYPTTRTLGFTVNLTF